METKWIRGEVIGRGSVASVSRASTVGGGDLPPIVALKSSGLSCCGSLQWEKTMLERVGQCDRVVRCFGDGLSQESGQSFYSLVLEFASQGSLLDEIRRHGAGGLPEIDIRRHTKSVLEGLLAIHAKGVVHCDIKPHNILLFHGGEAKVADFGLAKIAGESVSRSSLRGTPAYLAPESVRSSEYEAPCDVWALGCVVSEMASGRTAWYGPEYNNIYILLRRIVGDGGVDPEIPVSLSDDGKDFLGKIFVRDPKQRWTVQMLLNHPFVAESSPERNTCSSVIMDVPREKMMPMQLHAC